MTLPGGPGSEVPVAPGMAVPRTRHQPGTLHDHDDRPPVGLTAPQSPEDFDPNSSAAAAVATRRGALYPRFGPISLVEHGGQTMSTTGLAVPGVKDAGLVSRLNGRWHRPALIVFGVIVLGHWIEHVLQAVQIWVFDLSRPDAKGALGYVFPWLVTSEWLHYAYALVMLVGLALLLPGFSGRSRSLWTLAFAIQVWHHLEHLLLLYQAQAHDNLFGKPVPTSVLQLVWQRAELHLFYNAIVTIPMVIAMLYHLRPSAREAQQMICSCAHHEHELSPALSS